MIKVKDCDKYTDEEYNDDTYAKRIRNGSDLYISVQIAGCIVSYLVQNKIIKGKEADNKKLISEISDDILEWLQSEVEPI